LVVSNCCTSAGPIDTSHCLSSIRLSSAALHRREGLRSRD
jgi:hypothetical protein